MNYLANFITALALACGFISIIFSLESQFTFASWAIILSVIFDGLDGQVARINPVPSEFGKELDSLVDVVSFGIAPTVLGYVFVYQHFYLWAVLALFTYLVCSVLRLARYNVISREKTVHYFYGLPTTVGGAIVASFILIYRKYTELPAPAIFLWLILILAFLMVSNIRYLNLDGLKQLLRGKRLVFFIAITLPWLLVLPQVTIFALFVAYLILAPFLVNIVKID